VNIHGIIPPFANPEIDVLDGSLLEFCFLFDGPEIQDPIILGGLADKKAGVLSHLNFPPFL